jgi:AraC-like DNA-binding protein
MSLCKCGCGCEVKEGNIFIHGHNVIIDRFSLGDRWSIKHSECVVCGTTERRHVGRGLCTKCYRFDLYNRKKKNIGKWSIKFDMCVGCGRTDRPHKSKGFCTKCRGNIISRNKGKVQRNFGAWSWYYDKCRLCGTTETHHVKDGLCYNCYEESKRDLSSCVPCPVCSVLVNKLNQHLSMKSKKCKDHLTYQYNMMKQYFDSDMSLGDISKETGIERHALTRQFRKFFGKSATAKRNESVRTCNISEKAVINHNYKNNRGTLVEYDSPNQGKITLRSKLEATYASLLDKENIDWLYEYKTFPYIDGEGKRRTYTPDFFFPKENKFVEVKGYITELDQIKIEFLLSNGIDIEMITQSEVKEKINEV